MSGECRGWLPVHAVGVSTDFAALRRAGCRPMLLGIALWALVAATSLGVQAAFGEL